MNKAASCEAMTKQDTRCSSRSAHLVATTGVLLCQPHRYWTWWNQKQPLFDGRLLLYHPYESGDRCWEVVVPERKVP